MHDVNTDDHSLPAHDIQRTNAMNDYELQVWDGYSHHKRSFSADSYDDAVWKSGIAGHPVGWISLIVQLPIHPHE